ncbi:putative transcription factor B3-Domain family [Helianthus debilis subsp. tardiflorus]
MSFYKCFSSITKEFLVIPELFSKTWLSSAVDNNNDVIRCVNDKTWLVNFVGYNGRFAFMEGWEKVVADLSLSEGTVLVSRKIGPYTFLLTPFYEGCTLSTLSAKVCYLLPTDFVKNTIWVSKLKGAMKVYINAWNWFDVFIEKDPISKCYFFGDGWKKVVGFLSFNEKCVISIRYLFNYNFHLTLFDVNRCEVLVPKTAMENTAGGVDKHAGQTSNATPVVIELPDNQPAFDDESDSLDEDSDYHDSGEGTSSSDVSMDDVSHDEDDKDSGGFSDDAKDYPDYHPYSLYGKLTRLNARVAEMSRIDMSLKLTIQNLHGVDTVIDFRPEKYGQGFRYAASQWRKKFLNPNDIKAPQKNAHSFMNLMLAS